MSSDLLSTLQNSDPALLTEIVRKQQNSPMFELLDWTVEPISHARILDSTGGLFRFSGQGQDNGGVKAWSIVLKILKGWADDPAEDITNIFYWKREALAFESGLLDRLPSAVRAPRYYGKVVRGNDVWLWIEYLTDRSPKRWSLDDFRRSMVQFGRFSGAYLTGTPVPETPWLSTSSYRSGFSVGGGWDTRMNPDHEESVWRHPVVAQYFGDPIRARSLRFMAERFHFFDALDRLPQVLCHKDLNRRNMMFCAGANGQDELVVLDWAWIGSGAVGIDAGWTLIDALFFLDFDLAQAEALEAAILDGYLSGLRDAGWSGDKRLARLGYLVPLCMWMAILPGWAAMMLGENLDEDTAPMYGQKAPDVLNAWLALEEFLMPHVEETQALMHELNFE